MTHSFPLTLPQQRIWYTQQIYPESPMFNIGGVILIHGITDLELLLLAINQTIKLNDSFHLQITYKTGGDPLQYFVQELPLCTEMIDFSTNKSPKLFMESYFQQRFESKMQMIDCPLYEFVVFKVSENLYGYFVKLHHIVADGWSVQILTQSIGEMYGNLLEGSCGYDEGGSYAHFISEEQQYLSSNRFEKDALFWKNQFTTLPEKIRDMHEDTEGKRKVFYFGKKLTSQIQNFCQFHGITVNAFMIGVYILYKYKHEHNNDIVVGLPLLGRSGRKNRKTIGMFVSASPLRLQMRRDETSIEWLRRVTVELSKVYRHQQYPYDRLVRDLKLNHKSLYSECINYYGTSMCQQYGDNPSSNMELYNGQQQYNMQLIIRDWQDELQIDIDYKTKVYEEGYINSLYDNIKHIAMNFFSSHNIKLRDITLHSLNFQSYDLYENQFKIEIPNNENILSLIKQQAIKNSTKIAIQCGDKMIQYSELDKLSDGVAHFLKARHIHAGEIVGIYMSRCIETIIIILGILKAGCIYLPIDLGNKAKRITYMLQNANASVLFYNSENHEHIEFNGKVFEVTPDIWTNSNQQSHYDVYHKNTAAYIIYTSGSTGLPKGVVVSHTNLLNYILWAQAAYGIQADDVWPLYSSLAFDLTITSIFTPLVSGGKIIIYDDSFVEQNETSHVIERIMKDNICSVMKLTPSHLLLLKDEIQVSTKIKKLIVGGENLSYQLAKSIYDRFLNNVAIYNEYGPTEATVGCMIYQFDPNHHGDIVPIGQPTANNKILLLNEFMEPVPYGEKGEIYIAGLSVSHGYINNPIMTADRFIRVSDEMIIYKTGDIAYFVHPNTMVCCGRSDSQVKIMGYRIEPDEVAFVLQKHEKVQFAEVIALEDSSGQMYLCAYYTGERVAASQIEHFLKELLPFYMVPSDYIWLEFLPLTSNGKVNRAALPIPERMKNNLEHVELLSDFENNFLVIAQHILNKERISIYDNFYQLGGDSIKAVQLSSRLHDKGFSLKVRDILHATTIKEIIEAVKNDHDEIINYGICSGIVEPTSITSWFFNLKLCNPHHYYQYGFLTLEKPIDLRVLQDILRHLITHHDALRMNYDNISKKLFYNNYYIDGDINIKQFNNVGQDYMLDLLINELDITNKPLIQTGVNQIDDRYVWCIVIHHLVIDGLSWRILLEDIDTLIGQYEAGKEFILPYKTSSYQQWAQRVHHHQQTCIDSQEKENSLSISTQRKSTREYLLLVEDLPMDKSRLLFERANNAYRTHPIEIMLTALITTIPKYLTIADTLVELEFHGRSESDDINITRSVGWFTRIAVLETCEGKSTNDTLLHVKNKYRELLQQHSFTPLLHSQVAHHIIRFNYLGEFQGEYNHFKLEPQQRNNNEMTATIEIDLVLQNGKLRCQCRINDDLSYINAIEKFCDSYMEELSGTIDYCVQQEDIILTPSDFDMVELTNDELQQLFEE